MPGKARSPEILPSNSSSNSPAVAYYAPATSQSDFEPETPAVPFAHYLWILRRHLWRILAFVATSVLITAIVTARLQPLYEATATVVVDFAAPSGVVGQSSSNSYYQDPDAFLTTQIQLLQSDAVLRPVAEQFHLLRTAEQSNKAESTKTQQSISAPVSLGSLRITRPTGTNILLISYRTSDARTAADIANAVANSYLAHLYSIHIRSSSSLSSFMEKRLDELKAKMERSNLALGQFEKDLDVINPEDKSNVLSARLLQLNSEYTTAQIDRVNKQAALDAVSSGSLESAQVSTQGESLAKLTDSLNQARQHFALVKASYGSNHPEYRKAQSELSEVEKQLTEARANIAERVDVQYRQALSREQLLGKTVKDTKAEWDSLNSRSFQYRQLKQEADADKELYDELVKKIQEADINAGFQNNNISIADSARPPQHPVYPRTIINLLMAFFVSMFLAVGSAVLHDALDTTLRDPQEASQFLGVEVIGTLPVDQGAAQLPKATLPSLSDSASTSFIPNRASNGHYGGISGFEEAVRTIRNTILLSDFDSRLRSIALTSAGPSEGKSTVAAHLAIANATRGKRTLLVDGDLRRPSLHSKFAVVPQVGLSNVLTGEMEWQDAVMKVDEPNLSLLPAGPGSHRAADLIGPRLSHLLDEFAKEYDFVIIDAPPLLGFAECLQISSAADGILIVALAGETRRKAVAAVISVLNRLRANIIGVVLNQVSRTTSSEAYSQYGYYSYGRYDKAQSEKQG
jgi:polysaccharide biosynthesis transport protein